MSSDGFEIVFDDNFRMLSKRLATFGETVANRITSQALSKSARMMRDAAKEKAPDSTKFISDILRLPDYRRSKYFWYVTDSSKHLLKVKGSYQEIPSYNLKRNIKFGRVRNAPKSVISYRVYVHLRASWYAKFIEFGTSKMAAKPFMRPTFEQNYKAAALLMKQMIVELIGRGGY